MYTIIMAFGPKTLQGEIIFSCKYLKLNKVEPDLFLQKLEHPSSQNVMQRRKAQAAKIITGTHFFWG